MSIESRLRDIVIGIVREEQGDAGLVHRTFHGKPADPNDWSVPSWPQPADPLAAIRIARDIVGQAQWLKQRYIENARGVGRSWLELADVLGVDQNSDERDHDAFMIAAGEPSSAYGERYVSFRCSTCGQRIKDNGPYGGHPSDCETGHYETCARLVAQIDAYEKAWED